MSLRGGRVWWGAVAAALAVCPSRAADADDAGPGGASAGLVENARRAEESANPARAAELYRRALDGDLDASDRRRAESRLRWIEARREGAYVPLRKLLEVRNARGSELTVERVDALMRAARRFPPGLVRREALGLAGDLYLRRFARPQQALDVYETWAREPGISAAERALAVSGAALARDALGDPSGGAALMASRGMTRRPEMAYLRARAIGRVLRPIAWAALAAFLAIAAIAGGWRRLSLPVVRDAFSVRALTLAAFALLPPIALARMYEDTLERRFVIAAVGAAVVLAITRLSAAGLDGAAPRARRMWLALGGISAQLAVAALTLDSTDALVSWLQPAPLGQ